MIGSSHSQRGYSLIETLLSMALGVTVLAGAVVLVRSAADVGDMVGLRSELQQNVRVALNVMASDLRQAGTNVPQPGVALPTGDESEDSVRCCDQDDCYITNNVYSNERLYNITSGNGLGPVINGVATDVVTTVFKDPGRDEFSVTQIDQAGGWVRVASDTDPPITDAVRGIKIGDILFIGNSTDKSAAAVVSGVTSTIIALSDDDPLGFNQSQAAFGTVGTALSTPCEGDEGEFVACAVNDRVFDTPVSAKLVKVITYFIDNSDPNNPRLMRQVNAHPPAPVAEHVENLQVTYDIFDEGTGNASAAIQDPSANANQIRQINIELTVRAPKGSLFGKRNQYMTLRTSVSARNLSVRDPYL